MSDVGTLVALTIPLVIAATFDWWVARRYVIAAIQRPHIPVLTAGAWVRTGIAISATITAILGVASLWLLLSGQRVIPQPWGTILLYLATIIPSLANLASIPSIAPREVDK